MNELFKKLREAVIAMRRLASTAAIQQHLSPAEHTRDPKLAAFIFERISPNPDIRRGR